MALLMQLSAHFQHDVQAKLFTMTGRLSRISMISSGHTKAHTPVLSQASESIVMAMGDLPERAPYKPRAPMEPIQGAV
jgi:hypothetical protein